MTTIMLLAVAAWLLLERFGPGSNVAAWMSMLLILVLTVLGVMDHEAKSNTHGMKRRGVCILVSTIGGFVAFIAFMLSTDLMEPYLPLDGPLDTSDGPVKYAVVAANAVAMVLGSWLPLRAMRLWREHGSRFWREEPHDGDSSLNRRCLRRGSEPRQVRSH
ncbi:hypothetical protein [Bradyrhizobium sp. BR 10289]|uniref:hypothetical protein n=1 Tax=Bradyrhizobium sp. BR 10289 TaxID=2749993 RepID=UPI001C652AB6|nr:hypothetical protein [Bradyrhizobium sp. BR 10289]MBW7973249.1 hypothetical protein [Bradyrhizobium sp. BR 10289]